MNKVRDTIFFLTIDITYYDWCIIKRMDGVKLMLLQL